MAISFRKAHPSDLDMIHQWWREPHVVEFWDNSDSMWQNAEDYIIHGRKDIFDYWVALHDEVPFALVMEADALCDEEITYPAGERICSIDFMIGNTDYLGKGLAAPTLKAFMASLSPVRCFQIDPAADNPRAIHVYEQAGFKEMKRFIRHGGYFDGKEHLLMLCHYS